MTDRVTQTILHDPAQDGVPFGERIFGNCLQAAVASFFGWPLDAVPHFSQFLWWDTALELWARGLGYTVRTMQTTEIPEGRCILGGKSPRGVAHVVVAQGGEIVWDPHPSRGGLVSITDAMWFEESEPDDDEGDVGHGGQKPGSGGGPLVPLAPKPSGGSPSTFAEVGV
jgi:hypothetical protein